MECIRYGLGRLKRLRSFGSMDVIELCFDGVP